MQKGLSLSNVRVEEKDRGSKFYNKYEWAVSWCQTEVNVLRNSLEVPGIEKALENARYWEHQRHQSKWGNYYSNNTTSFKSSITKTVVDEIHRLGLMLNTGPENKRVLGVGYITVYTDDADFKDKLIEFGNCHRFVTVRHANVVYPNGSIALADPKYKYRTYLRSRKMSEDKIAALKVWTDAQGAELRVSPGLQDFFKRKDTRWFYSREWTADYYFFDHNDLRYETMLHMILPGTIRKTVPIIAK